MKALSIRQPWASLIISGGKDIENRDWPTRIRGRVLVHAAKTMHPLLDFNDAIEFAARVTGRPFIELFDRFEHCPRGGIIGSVEIVDCVTRSDSRWFMGRHGFVLRDPQPLPFVPLRGQLGFFDVAGAA